MIQQIGQTPDLDLLGRVLVEVRANGQRTREQEGRVDRGELAIPHATTGFDVEEVVEEPLVPGRVRLRALRTLQQELQSLQRDLRAELSMEHPAFDDDRNRRQR